MKLSVWNNKWSEVYDFTPPEGCGNNNSSNWSPIDMADDGVDVGMVDVVVEGRDGDEETKTTRGVVPITVGKNYDTNNDTSLFLLFYPSADFSAVHSALLKWYGSCDKSKNFIVRTREYVVDKSQITQLTGNGKDGIGKCLAIQLSLASVDEEANTITGTMAADFSTTSRGVECSDLFFDTWKEAHRYG